mmetsp:Transcript_18307/g.28129  ORF Transcript_18307/g.28129 Transcript_18307/m.28129 type:complete len:144 (-) Transcript_18307:163-594(-)
MDKENKCQQHSLITKSKMQQTEGKVRGLELTIADLIGKRNKLQQLIEEKENSIKAIREVEKVILTYQLKTGDIDTSSETTTKQVTRLQAGLKAMGVDDLDDSEEGIEDSWAQKEQKLDEEIDLLDRKYREAIQNTRQMTRSLS